jgi:hypothetical protein
MGGISLTRMISEREVGVWEGGGDVSRQSLDTGVQTVVLAHTH